MGEIRRKVEITYDGEQLEFKTKNIDMTMMPIIAGGLIRHLRRKDDIPDEIMANAIMAIASVVGMDDQEFREAFMVSDKLDRFVNAACEKSDASDVSIN